MLSFTKKTDYALTAMVALAKNSSAKPYPLSQMAQDQNLPYKFLSQIAIDLKKAGLIQSKEGFGGGYVLSKPPSQISVADIVHATEGPVAPVPCLRGKAFKNHKPCTHRRVLVKISRQVETSLTQTSLTTLL
jgi:Rrf2 family protein